MKDAASLKAQNLLQEYMEKKYVSHESLGTGIVTAGDYIASQIVGIEGGYTYSVSGTILTVTDIKDNMVIGRILENGNISWVRIDNNEQQIQAETIQSLASSRTIKKGDSIIYNPGTATIASVDLPEGTSLEGTKLASVSLPEGAILDGTIRASDASNWIVLDVNQDTGEVAIVPLTVSNTKLTLSGKDGYDNSIVALNTISSIFVNDKYAKEARSINEDDVLKYNDATVPTFSVQTLQWNHRYGIDPNTLMLTDAGENNEINQEYKNTRPSYYIISKILGSAEIWLASRQITVGTSWTNGKESADMCVLSKGPARTRKKP